MPVLIKNVDPELYKKFKARAIEQGMKIDEAFNEAIVTWLDKSRNKAPREQMQERNELAYKLLRKTLEKEYPDKWVAIIDGQLATTANSREELFNELGKIKTNENPALVFQAGFKPKRATLCFNRIQRERQP